MQSRKFNIMLSMQLATTLVTMGGVSLVYYLHCGSSSRLPHFGRRRSGITSAGRCLICPRLTVTLIHTVQIKNGSGINCMLYLLKILRCSIYTVNRNHYSKN